MKVKSLEINNFRGIPHLKLDFHEQTNVLVGVNGSGKSSILDCLAIMLSRLICRIRSSRGTGRLFSIQNITNGKSRTHNTIEVSVHNRKVRWMVAKSNRGRSKQTISNLIQLQGIVDYIRAEMEIHENYNLPLAVYYPVNRDVLDVPLRIRTKHPFDQLSAYDQSLTGAPDSFRVFFEWFREREDLENEKRMEEPQYRDPQLQAVRNAIENFMPCFSGLRVKRAPLRMVVHKDGDELIVDQLSDGEKCMLAMVGDLARRLAIANPSLNAPLNGEGIVLIDEVDLHLHPGWQRMVVPGLERTFPNSQFILATHSPQILSHVKPECIWLLQRSKEDFTAVHPEDAYGLDSNRILEDIMDVPERPLEIQKILKQLFLAIDQGKLENAQTNMEKLRGTIGSDPELAKAEILIRRREILKQSNFS